MKRTTAIWAVLSMLLMASNAFADQPPYGWSISASETDPFVNTTDGVAGFKTVYLWFVCSTPETGGGPGGMASAEFVVCADAANIVGTVLVNGFLNAGPPPSGGNIDLLLAVGSCPEGPVVAVNILMTNTGSGQVCICPVPKNGNQVTVDCAPAPTAWPIEWIGLDKGTGQSCGEGDVNCDKPVSVEDSSWGTIKGLYR